MGKCMENLTSAFRKAGKWFCGHWKVVLGVAFKLSLVAIGCVAAYVLYIICSEELDVRYGPRGRQVINVKSGIYAQKYADNTQRLRNQKTGKWLSSREKWFCVEPEDDSISVYCSRDGLRGFYNTRTGEITMSGRFRHAWYFSDGVAAVVGEDDRVRFINHDGSEAVPGRYHYSEGADYVFKDGLCKMYNDSTETVGLLRKDGTWALAQEYEHIAHFECAGVYITLQEGMYQIWKADFTPAIEGSFDKLKMTEDYGAVYATRDHIKQKLPLDGKVIEPFIIDGTYELKYMTRYNEDEADEYEIIPEVVVYTVDNYEGLMDKRTGKILTPACYQEFDVISRTLLKAVYATWMPEGVVMDLQGRIIREN